MRNGERAVLLVEDEENDVLLIRRAFGKARMDVPLHVAENGEVAISYLEGRGAYADRDRHPLPALLLLDLKLPRMSGLEVLEWLRARPGLRRLPVVVLTSSRESVDVNRAYDLGANSYLVKPVRPADLLDLVKSLDLYWLVLNEQPEISVP